MDEERQVIDPEGRYPSSGMRRFEHVALNVTRWRRINYVLSRTRDAIEVRFPDDGDDDGELIVILTPDAIELRLYEIDWTRGSYGPAPSSTLWRRLTWEEVGDIPVGELLDDLRVAHQERLETCIHCAERFIESRMAEEACHGCAERIDGVVF